MESTGTNEPWVQQSLSRLLNKTQQNLNGDDSLKGLVIDWHLAEYDYSVECLRQITNQHTLPRKLPSRLTLSQKTS